jgi:TetR/AcrR family tetracycline transcriptional repressor
MAAASKRVAVPAGMRRAFGEFDRTQVVWALHNVARRVGAQGVTVRELATELSADAASVYYHVPGKQAALDLLAESVLVQIPVPESGPWDVRLVDLYCAAHEVIIGFPGVVGILRTRSGGERARRLDRISRSLLAEAGLAKAAAAAAHTVLYTHLLGSVALEESRMAAAASHGGQHAAKRFRAGLDVITAGIRATAVW